MNEDSPDWTGDPESSAEREASAKSLVTASLRTSCANRALKWGILDADITGPSIPKMYGIKGPAKAGDRGIEPIAAENGIKIMSINLLLPNADDPVIWRGPVIAKYGETVLDRCHRGRTGLPAG